MPGAPGVSRPRSHTTSTALRRDTHASAREAFHTLHHHSIFRWKGTHAVGSPEETTPAARSPRVHSAPPSHAHSAGPEGGQGTREARRAVTVGE